MTTITVTGPLLDATKNPVCNAQCLITLVGSPAFDTGSAEIVTIGSVKSDAVTGIWTASLTPNSELTPANTYYVINEPGGVSHAFVVPASGGPYLLNALLVTSPTSPDASLGVVRYDVAQPLTPTQQAQAKANIGAGTGAVASVFGRSGAVTAQPGDYTAAQVGADASGAAAAAQAAAIAAAATDATTKANAAQAASLQKSANLSDVANAGTSRTNLGLGGSATLNVGTTAGTVAAGDDSRITGAVPTSRTLAGLDLTANRTAAAIKTALAIAESDVTNLTADLAAKVPLSTVSTKGDLIVATGSGAVTRLPVGADGTVPVADSTQAGGMGFVRPLPFASPASGEWVTSQFGLGNGTAGISLNDAYPMPLIIEQTAAFNSMAVCINTAGSAGAVMRLGIYGSSASGKPGTLLLDAGTVPATSTGVQQLTISQSLTPGLYWLVAVPQVALSQYRAFGTSAGPHLALGASNLVIQTPGQNFYRAQGMSGALPSTPTWPFVGNIGGTSIPAIGLVAS